MKHLLPLPLLAVLLTVIAGCRDSAATPLTDQANRTVQRKEVEPSATIPGSGTGDEKKTEPPQANQAEPSATTSGPSPSPASDTTPPATAPEKPTPDKSAAEKSAPEKSVEAQKISFDDLNCGIQADIVFRPWMLTNRVKELDGQQVRIVGYMNPDVKQHGITEFILLRNTECKFGPSGQADHLIRVKLDPGVTTNFSSKPVQIVGKLIVNPFTGPDGKTWCIFDMTGQTVGAPQR